MGEEICDFHRFGFRRRLLILLPPRPRKEVKVRKIRDAICLGGGTCTSSPRLDCTNTRCKANGIRGDDCSFNDDDDDDDRAGISVVASTSTGIWDSVVS